MHRHPGFEERMRVEGGRLTVRFEDGARHLGPGDGQLVVEPGRWHTAFNRSRTTVRFDVEVRPPGRLREFFDGLARWTVGVPNPTRVADLFWRHRHEVELRGVAKVAVRLLGRTR
jgi:hypothetical protein